MSNTINKPRFHSHVLEITNFKSPSQYEDTSASRSLNSCIDQKMKSGLIEKYVDNAIFIFFIIFFIGLSILSTSSFHTTNQPIFFANCLRLSHHNNHQLKVNASFLPTAVAKLVLNNPMIGAAQIFCKIKPETCESMILTVKELARQKFQDLKDDMTIKIQQLEIQKQKMVAQAQKDIEKIKQILENGKENLKQNLQDDFISFLQKTMNISDNVQEKVQEITTSVSDFKDQAWDSLKSTFSGIIDGGSEILDSLKFWHHQ